MDERTKTGSRSCGAWQMKIEGSRETLAFLPLNCQGGGGTVKLQREAGVGRGHERYADAFRAGHFEIRIENGLIVTCLTPKQ